MSHGRFQARPRPRRAPAPPFSDAAALAVVADRLDVPSAELNAWTDAALVRARSPDEGGAAEIDVADVTLLRSLCDAGRPGLPPSAMRRTLDDLRARVPASAEPTRKATFVVEPSSSDRHGNDVAGSIGRDSKSSPGDWHAAGVEHERAGRHAAAVHAYEQALRTGGPDAQIVFDLAYALAAAGETGRAGERYRQVIEIDPARGDAWVNLGDLLLDAGDTAAAIAAFRHALDLDPDDTHAHYDLAEAFDLAGDAARAALHWAAFTRLSDAPSAQLHYARHRLTNPASTAVA